MKLIRGAFNYYRDRSSNIINESYGRTSTFSSESIRCASGTTVFVSHKHEDLNDLKGLLDYLSHNFNVVPYIDSMDKGMPLNTCAETANRIKQAIYGCEKFILLGTNKALSSKWCNWEVGIADKWKLPAKDMAILPMLDSGDSLYNGSEYLEIYPYINEVKDSYGGRHLNVIYFTSNGFKRTISLVDWLKGSNY